MTFSEVLYWGLGGGCALLTGAWAWLQIEMRIADEKMARFRLAARVVGGGATLVTMAWMLYGLSMGRP